MIPIKDLKILEPKFRFKVQSFLWDTRIKELWIKIAETFRSQERQIELWNKWRPDNWPVVTWLDWVKNKSIHQSWEAFDIAFVGLVPYPKDFKLWREVANIAKIYGIEWGFDLWWRDLAHFQNDKTVPYSSELEAYKKLHLRQKIRRLRDRLSTYKRLTLKQIIDRLKARKNKI